MIDRAGDLVTYYDGRVETCRVHDMMLEVMVSRSLESNFVSLVGGPYEGMSYDRIRRLSIHGGEEPTLLQDSPSNKTAAARRRHGRKNGVEGMDMQHVRSLSMFGPGDHSNVLDRLDEFTLLRMLDLEDCMGINNEHLRYVCRMYLLRFLSLKGTVISKMPEEVGQLENLETLDVRQTHLEDLPGTMSMLEKLEHVHISNKNNSKGWIARRGLGRMKALRTVKRIVFGHDADAAEAMGKLQQLRELTIHMDFLNRDTIHQDFNKKLAKSLSKICSLRWLNLSSIVERKNQLNFLHDLDTAPLLLEYLRIGGGISKLPDWVGSLNNLVEIFIAWTFFVGNQLFGPVCKLPNLKHMNLEGSYYEDRVLVAETAHSFPALKDLYLNFDIDRMEVLRFKEESMAKLEKLSVRMFNREHKTVVSIKHLKNLKEVELTGTKNNPALDNALQQIMRVNEMRPKSNQIKVAVKYE